MERIVFHIRLKQYEIQVERVLDASLSTRAIAVISSNQQDGTIVSLSKEAKEEGLWAGMRVSLARKMSHRVKLMPFNESLYSRMHHYIYENLQKFSPVIEPAVFGQFYMDMTGMERIYKNPDQAGYQVFLDLRNKVNLQSQVGISENKLVSNISTAVVPQSIYEVNRGGEASFLAPLTSQVLPVTREKAVTKILRFLFLEKVKNVQAIVGNSQSGSILFGKHYKQLAMEANGRDDSVVKTPQLRDHILKQTILREDTNDDEILTAAVGKQAEQLAYELRCRDLVAGKLKLEIHYTDGFKKNYAGSALKNDNESVISQCDVLFRKANYRRNRIRALLIDASEFRPASHQLNLFEAPKQNDISKTLDKIRNRFGFSCIKTASQMLIPELHGDKHSRPVRITSGGR